MVIALFIALLSSVYILIQKPTIQTWLISKITTQLSRKSNAKISIGRVDIVFFKKLILEDILIADEVNDTIFYSQWISARIDNLNIKTKSVNIGEITIEDNKAHIVRDSASHFNFSFIIDSLQNEKNTSAANLWKIRFNKFNLKNTEIKYEDPKLKVNNELFVHQLNTGISDFSNENDSIRFNIEKIGLYIGDNFKLKAIISY